MPTRKQIVRGLLKPVSWIYGSVMAIRNWMFDNNILPQTEYDVPVVGVGNITVGGTGKTPHVEYLVEMLSLDYNIAVLSRGYKRKTKGFLLASSTSTPDSIGDEPLQIFQKYGMRVKVAVCESRKKGIEELLRLYPEIQLIILDDSFQHRYVKPKVSILLTDYHRPIYSDHLLPLGRLRESKHQMDRADIIVVTKCPPEMRPIDYSLEVGPERLNVRPYQSIFFSTLRYGGLLPVFPDDKPYNVNLAYLTEKDTVMLLTGIANPRGFVRYFRQYKFRIVVAHYSDHHDFSRQDLKHLKEKFDKLTGERKLIITTEKDSVRLAYNPYFPASLKQRTFYMPIAIKMIEDVSGKEFIADLRKRIEER